MRLLHVLAVLLCAQAVALADLKVSRKMGAGGYGGGESTVYIKGQRQRTEMPGIISIQQCDLRRTIQINDQTKKYLIMPDDAGQPEASAPAAAAPQGPTQTRRGAVVTVTESIVDTGERKQMFGYTARHIKTKNVIDAPPEACNPGHMETETDGWYIDLAAGFSCDTDRPPTPPARRARPDCVDQYRTRRTGAGKLGFPVMVTYKSGGGEMGGGFASTLEVTDISTVTLDPSLFDIPAGYTQAASFQELMGMPGGMMGIPAVAGETPGAQAPAAEAEAKQKDCDLVLYTDLSALKQSGGKFGGMLGRATGIGGSDRYESRVDFKLFAVGGASQLESNATAKEEGAEASGGSGPE